MLLRVSFSLCHNMTQMHLSTSCASFVLISPSLSLGDVDMDRGCIERANFGDHYSFDCCLKKLFIITYKL